MTEASHRAVVALAGGVGGARLFDGLHRVLPVGSLTAIVNTGDDFEHWGLRISPDLDTVMYTLAGLAPEERGWGIEGDSFRVLEETSRRGGEAWFQLGDRDLVTHLVRTSRLVRGESLTRVTEALCHQLGVERRLLPMSNDPRGTVVVTAQGEEIPFQQWLVRRRSGPRLRSVRFEGSTKPSPDTMAALQAADLVLICPSNPFVSIDPILTLDGVRAVLEQKTTVAVSPVIGGRAVKGPLATMIADLAHREPTARAVAEHYGGLLDGYAIHPGDRFDAPFPLLEVNVLIQKPSDRIVFARELLRFAESLR